MRNVLDKALESDRAEVVEMAEDVLQMLLDVRRAFDRLRAAPLDEADRVGRRVHQEEHAILDRIAGPTAGSGAGPGDDDESLFVPTHLERAADQVQLLADATRKLLREGILFTDRATREVDSLFDTATELLEALRDALRTGNRTLVRYVLDAGRVFEQRANEFALFHEQRLVEGVCVPRSSSSYLAMLDAFRGIEWHARQVAEKIQRAPTSAADRTKLSA